MKQLFGFRNDIAHGKSEIIKTSGVTPLEKHSDAQLGDHAQTQWEKYCTKENAQKAREDVEKIVFALYEAGPFEHDYPFICGFQLHSAKVIDD